LMWFIDDGLPVTLIAIGCLLCWLERHLPWFLW